MLWSLPGRKNGGKEEMGERLCKVGLFSLWFVKWRDWVISVTADAMRGGWGPPKMEAQWSERQEAEESQSGL